MTKIPFTQNETIWENHIDHFIGIIEQGKLIHRFDYNINRCEPNFGRTDLQVKKDEAKKLIHHKTKTK